MNSEPSSVNELRQLRLLNHPLVAVAVLLIVLAVHGAVNIWLFRRVELPPFYDAANHVNIALEIKDHLDHFRPSFSWLGDLWKISGYYPPAFHIVAALCLKFVSFTPDGVRLANLFFLGILMFSVYGIGRKLYDTKVGLFAGVLVSLFPVVHGLTREIYIDLALLSWSACGVYFLLSSDHFRNPLFSGVFGLTCGFGLLTKWTFPVFIGGPVLWVLSETFLPFSVSRFLLGLLTSGLDIREDQRIGRAALTIFGWITLLFALSHLLGGKGLFLPWSLLSFVGAGCLYLGQISRRRPPSFETVIRDVRRDLADWKRSVVGVGLAGIAMLLVACPWYLLHWDYIAYEGGRVLTEAAQVRGMPRVGTAASFLYYFLTLESHQLHPAFWLLSAGCVALVITRVQKDRAGMFLVCAFGLSYLVMSSLWVKDPRYFTPGLYPLPVLIAATLLNLSPDRRMNWVLGTLLVGALGYWNQVFGLPVLSAQISIPTPFGPSLRIAGRPVYGDLLRFEGEWPHHRIVEDLLRDISSQRHLEGMVRVPMLVDDGFVHAPAMNCYAKFHHANLQFFNVAYHPDYRLDPGFTKRLLNVLRAPYVITKTGGSLGLDFVTARYKPLLERLSDDGIWGQGLREIGTYSTPLKETVHLWSNTFPAAFLSGTRPLKVRVTNGIEITGYRFSANDGFRKGQLALFQVEWTPAREKDLDELIDRYSFFLHLVDTENNRFVQGWNFPLTEETVEVAHFQVQSGSPKAVVGSALIDPREDIPPGRYEFRLGVFQKKDLREIPFDSVSEDPPTSIRVGNSFVYEPDGWEWVHTRFEDRKLLEVLDHIGALILESARFSPTSATPGGEIVVETTWYNENLELKTPEQRDIRVFGYLFPVVVPPGVHPVSLVSKPLRQITQRDSEKRSESVRMTLPLPSNLTEGEWRIHIGVDRPLYNRHLVIRGGPQADRRDYVLGNPLLVGLPHWRTLNAGYPRGITATGARILSTTPTGGSQVRFQVSWKADRAEDLIETASSDLLFAHLFSLEEERDITLANFPIFDRKQIGTADPRLKKLGLGDYFEAIRGGFSETYSLNLEESVLPGSYRLDFGVFNPAENRKIPATLVSGATTTTLSLPVPVRAVPPH